MTQIQSRILQPAAPSKIPDNLVTEYLSEQHSPLLEFIDEAYQWLQPKWAMSTTGFKTNFRSMLYSQWNFHNNDNCYLVFWGPFTTMLLMYLLNCKPFHDCMDTWHFPALLISWNILLSYFMFVFGKLSDTFQAQFMEHISYLSYQYVFVLIFLVGCSINKTLGSILALGSLMMMTYCIVTAYQKLYRADICQLIIIICIVSMMNGSLIYLLVDQFHHNKYN